MHKTVLLVATVQSHILQFHIPLMKLLKESGWEIHVAARNNLQEKPGLKMIYADRVYDVPFQRSPFQPKNVKAYQQLKTILADTHYDVIHCNTPVGGMLARGAAREYRKKGTRVIYTAHGFHFYIGAPIPNWLLYYPLERFMAHYTDTLITITDEDYRRASKTFPCKVVRMHGVGADETRFKIIDDETKKTIRQDLGYGNEPIIMNIGELLPNKNQKMAIAAMPEIIKEYPTAKLLIAGNGNEEENLRNQIDTLGLQDHISLLGYTREVNRYTEICDVLVTCSYREGMPLNVMEAMLCGKPVVATHNRGHNELVAEGETGYLVIPDDVNNFAKAVCKVLKRPSFYSKAARNRVEPYTYSNVQQELRNIYHL